MSGSIRHFLTRQLPPEIVDVLDEVSDGWTSPLFSYDEYEKRYEPAASIDVDNTDAIDALCMAAEALAAFTPRPDDALLFSEQRSGTVTLTFRFDTDRLGTYDRFMSLFEHNMGSDAGFSGEFQKSVWGARAIVTLSYLNDFDYKRKKEMIDTLLLIAKKQSANTPFHGHSL